MENKLLYSIKFKNCVRSIKKIAAAYGDSFGSKIVFTGIDKIVTISDIHEQDCCESVYADWSPIKDSDSEYFSKLEIKSVKDIGFLLCFNDTKTLVPCYNQQNGYYSSNLSLEITKQNVGSDIISKQSIDISDCIIDNTD
jgi:hypothetical protein